MAKWGKHGRLLISSVVLIVLVASVSLYGIFLYDPCSGQSIVPIVLSNKQNKPAYSLSLISKRGAVKTSIITTSSLPGSPVLIKNCSAVIYTLPVIQEKVAYSQIFKVATIKDAVAEQLTSEKKDHFTLSYDTQNDQIFYTQLDNGNQSIAVMKNEKNAASKVIIEKGFDPTVVSKDQIIYYAHYLVNGSSAIFKRPIMGGNEERVIDNGGFYDAKPLVSPDNRSLVMQRSTSLTGLSNLSNIYFVDLTQSSKKAILKFESSSIISMKGNGEIVYISGKDSPGEFISSKMNGAGVRPLLKKTVNSEDKK